MIEELERQSAAILAPVEARDLSDAEMEEKSSLKQDLSAAIRDGVRGSSWLEREKRASVFMTGPQKDLSIYGGLAFAWTANHKLAGLVVGLETLAGLLEQHWERLVLPPKFIRAALMHLQKYFTDQLVDCQSTDDALLNRGVEAAKKVKLILLDRFEDPPCDFSGIRRKLEDWLAAAPAPQPTAESAAVPAPASESAAAAPAPQPTAPTPLAPVPAAVAQVESEPRAADVPEEKEAEESPLIAAPMAGVIDKQTLTRILAPIGDSGVGENPRRTDEFEDLSDEINKAGAIGGGGPDWNTILENGVMLLSETGKSLYVAAFLGGYWLQHFKLSGAVTAMEVMHDMIYQYWDKLFVPPKIRGIAIRWIHDRIGRQIEELIASDDRDVLQRSHDAAAALRVLMLDKFEEPPVDFLVIRNKLNNRLEQLPQKQDPVAAPPTQSAAAEPAPEPVAAPAPQAAAPQAAPQAASPQAAKVTAPVPSADLDQAENADDVYRELSKIVTALQTFEPTNPLAAMLARRIMWRSAKQPPDKNGKTMIPPPAKQIRTSLETMIKNAAWDRVFEKSEEYCVRFIFWLDLQYYAAQAAANEGHDALIDIIEKETLSLVERVPGVVELSFRDGHPFASDDTRAWLKKAAEKAAAGSGEITVDPVEELRADLSKAGADGFTDAMTDAQQRIRAAADPREIFGLKLTIAKYCLAVDQLHVAEGLIENLTQEALDHDLAWWDPDTAGLMWALCIDIYRKAGVKDKSYLEKERLAMRHLAGLDLKRAASVPVKKIGMR